MVKRRSASASNSEVIPTERSRSLRSRKEVVQDVNSSDSDIVSDRKRIRRARNSSASLKSTTPNSNSKGIELVLSESDGEEAPYTSKSGRRVVNNKLLSDYDSQYYKKTRHSPETKNKNDDEHLTMDNSEENVAPLRSRPVRGRGSKSNPITPLMNGDINFLDDDSSIRRSTRQRKVVFDTLDQSWLLGTTTSGAAFRNDADNSNIVQNFDEPFKDDMYSRVKQRRVKHRNMYTESEEKKEELTGEEAEGGDEESDHISSCEEAEATHSKYHLRPKKPITDRLQLSHAPSRTRSSLFNHTASPVHRPYSFRSSIHRSPMFKSRRHAAHNNSSTSSSSDDEMRFERRKKKSMVRARNRFLPMNMNNDDIAVGSLRERAKIGSSLADVDPMALDKSVNFESIGGLNHHLNSLKEMIIFPLMYPEIFEKFRISPPRGVLFYGPPGTGKTLVARALANECSHSNHKVAFFMRKGADCLSKWVGESERQLRLLFDQAYQMRPAIIFFDEIDGLAPVRSSRQDQIHSSIVSTLLALMDGLDNRGEVVVIGATNRIDSIDPALRRPGRFDREFNFPLPSAEARESILKIHTKNWNPALEPSFVRNVARKCVGYCGADLKALCAEAAILALKQRYPQIYSSRDKLVLDISSVVIKDKDFEMAMQKVVPAGHRAVSNPGRPLPSAIKLFLQNVLQDVLAFLHSIFPQGTQDKADADDDNQRNDGKLDVINEVKKSSHLCSAGNRCYRPRLILCGNKDQGQSTYLGPAILHRLEGIPVHSLDLASLYSESLSSEEACTRVFREARRNTPSIIYLPHIDQWWTTVNEPVIAIFNSLLCDISPSSPIFFLATSDCQFNELPTEIQSLFSLFKREVVEMKNANEEERRQWFTQLFETIHEKPQMDVQVAENNDEHLEVAPAPEPRKLNEGELKKLERQEENTLRELRIFLRQTINKLVRDRKFIMFAKPVNLDEVPDYPDVISNPMDLETMMQKIDLHKYESGKMFLEDVDLICSNALEYNPDTGPSDRLIRHRACALRDVAHDIIETEMDPEFEKMCVDIHSRRLKRGESPAKFAPKNYITVAQVAAEKQKTQTVSDSEVNRKPVVSKRQTSSMGQLVRCRKSPWFGGRRRRYVKPKRVAAEEVDEDKEVDDGSSSPKTQESSSQSANHNAMDACEDETLDNDHGETGSTALLNGHDSLDSTCLPDAVEVDACRLERLLDELVQITSDCGVEILEGLHATLSSCIHSYNHLWNKDHLLDELEEHVRRFKDCCS